MQEASGVQPVEAHLPPAIQWRRSQASSQWRSGFQPVALKESSGVQPVEEGSGFQPVALNDSSGVQPVEEGSGFQPVAVKAGRQGEGRRGQVRLSEDFLK